MLTPSASSTDVTERQGQCLPGLLHRPQPGRRPPLTTSPRTCAGREDRRHLPQRRRLLPGHPRHLRAEGSRARALRLSTRAPSPMTPPPTSPSSSPPPRPPAPTSCSCPSTISPLPSSSRQAKAMGYAPTFFGVDGMDGILDHGGLRYLPCRGRHAPDPVLRRLPRTQRPRASSTTYTEQLRRGRPTSSPPTLTTASTSSRPRLKQAGCTADMSAAGDLRCTRRRHDRASACDGLTGNGHDLERRGSRSPRPLPPCVIEDGQYVTEQYK